jgi:hypothetical protein
MKEHSAPFLQALACEQVARSGSQHPLLILHELKGDSFTPIRRQVAQGEALAAQIELLRECGEFFENARLEVRI